MVNHKQPSFPAFSPSKGRKKISERKKNRRRTKTRASFNACLLVPSFRAALIFFFFFFFFFAHSGKEEPLHYIPVNVSPRFLMLSEITLPLVFQGERRPADCENMATVILQILAQREKLHKEIFTNLR